MPMTPGVGLLLRKTGCADNRVVKSVYPTFLALLMSIDSPPAVCQQLEEVLVTAQKRSQLLQDIPVAISAFSRERLQSAGIDDSRSLQLVTPSLVFNNRGPIAQPFIRGIGTTLSLLGLEPSVATYVDDQYYPRPVGNMLEFPDVARVEVLKGPQGTLYGRNTSGGAIRIVTRDPGDAPAGSFKLTAGNYDYLKLSAYVEGPLNESLRANVSVMSATRDGFADQREPGMDDLDNLNVQTYRSKWVWQPSTSLTTKLSLDYTRRNDTAGSETIDITADKTIIGSVLPFSIGNAYAEALGGPVPPQPFGDVVPTGKAQDEIRSGVDRDNELRMFNVQFRVDLEVDALTFAAITTYQDAESQINTADFDASSLALSDIYDREQNDTFSQELRVASTAGTGLEWMAGLFYFQSEGEFQVEIDGSDFVVTGFQKLTSPQSRLDTKAWALFAEASYDFSERWSGTVGGRFSVEEKDIEADATPTGISDSEDWNQFTPKAVLAYDWSLGMAYLSYARGFKSGGYAYPYIQGISDAPVEPEVLDMLELGAKMELLDNTLRLNGALYWYDYEDLQVNRNASLLPGVGPVIPVENAGGAEVFGAELDLAWRASEQLQLMAGLNLLDSEYTDYDATPSVYNTNIFPGPVVVAVPYSAEGDELIRAPTVSGYVSLAYEFPLASGASLPLDITWSYRGEYDFDLTPGDASNRIDEFTSRAHNIVSARLGYDGANGNLKVAMWVKNLTDEEYYDEVVAFATAVRATVGAPRTYGVDLVFNF